MSALALILALGTTEIDLPRTLKDDASVFPAAGLGDELPAWRLEPQAARGQHRPLVWSVGGHLGLASAFDSDDAAFDIGGQARLLHLLPWLSVEGSIDFQTEQTYESGDIHVFILPIQFTALFYPPVDWPVRPYGLAGFGLYYEDIRFSGALGYKSNRTAFEPGFHLGFGADYALPQAPTIVLNADLRFVFLTHPGGLQGNDLDYLQFTVGVNFILQ